jgi:Tripartite tricarboxylate transporter TctB family
MKMTFTKKQIPHLVLFIVTSVFLFLSMGWPYETYLFPRLVCIIVLITVLISLYSEMREEKKNGPDHRNAWQASSMAEGRTVFNKTAIIMVWMLFYILAIWLVGYEYASVAFIFFFMKFNGEQGWTVSILAAIVALAFMMLVFDWGLGIKWPDGIIQEMLKQ